MPQALLKGKTAVVASGGRRGELGGETIVLGQVGKAWSKLGCGQPFRAGMKRAHREPGRHTPLCVTNQIKSNCALTEAGGGGGEKLGGHRQGCFRLDAEAGRWAQEMGPGGMGEVRLAAFWQPSPGGALALAHQRRPLRGRLLARFGGSSDWARREREGGGVEGWAGGRVGG
jgi:hypothetical protein